MVITCFSIAGFFLFSLNFMVRSEDMLNSAMESYTSHSNLGYLFSWMIVCEGTCFLFVCLRFITFLRLYWFLSLMVSVGGVAWKALFVVGLITIPIFASFAQLAVQIWGGHVLELATFSKAIGQLMYYFSGRGEVNTLVAVAQVSSIIYVCVFLILGLLSFSFIYAAAINAYYELRLRQGYDSLKYRRDLQQWIAWAVPSACFNIFAKIGAGSEDVSKGSGKAVEEAKAMGG